MKNSRHTTDNGQFPLLACLCVMLGLCMGCAQSAKRTQNNVSTAAPVTYDPQSLLSSLPNDTVARIETFTSKVPVPDAIPYSHDQEAGQTYLEWYRKGYSFAFVTGNEHLRDQVSRKHLSEVEQAKHLGWFHGNGAGGLARRQADIKSAVDSMTKEKPK